MPLVFSPNQRGLTILSRNPPRTPEEYKVVLEKLGRWATHDNNLITENAKMNKPVQGERWITRGFALLSANSLAKLAQAEPRPAGMDDDKPGIWGLNKKEYERMVKANFCPAASPGCKLMCLVDAGQMGLPTSRAAQIGRSLNWIFNKDEVRLAMIVGITRLYAYARKKNARLGFRLNVTSDLPWEQLSIDMPAWLATYMNGYGLTWVKPGRYQNIMELFDGPYSTPRVMFYDYTKIAHRIENMWKKDAKGEWPRNYHLAWSLSEEASNRAMALWALSNKVTTVAAPFNRSSGRMKKDGTYGNSKEPLPDTLSFTDHGKIVATFPVVDADKHDLRFKDPLGAVSGLRFKVPKKPAIRGMKNKEKAEVSKGFIVDAPTQHPTVSLQGGAYDNQVTNPRRNPAGRACYVTLRRGRRTKTVLYRL